MARIETASIPCVSASVTAAVVICSRESEGAGPRAARSGRSQMTPRLEPIANSVLSLLRCRQRLLRTAYSVRSLKWEPSADVATIVQTEGLAKPAGAATQPAARNPLRWFVLAVVLAANIMDTMDATIVNVAGPSIRHAIGGGASTLQWLSAGYTLAFAVFLITGARLGDIFGRRRLFLVGSAGFTVMSAACAVAPSPAVLIGFRVLQGSFGALMIPQGVGMLKEVFAEDEMTKVFGAYGPMIGLSVLAAPILAGALVEANLWGIGWRLVFLINVPIGIVAFAGAVRVLPRTIAHPGIRLDTGGMILDWIRADRDHLPADSGPHGRLASVDLCHARGRGGAARRVRGVGAPPARRSADRPSAAGQPHLHERDPRRARLLRRLQRSAAVRHPCSASSARDSPQSTRASR